MHLNPYTILPLLCMVLAIICGTFVIRQNPKAKLNRIFLAICITFTAWFSFYIPFNFHYTDKLLIIWFRISYCFISFIPITCFTFISTYLQAPKNEFWFKINALIGFTFSILSITTNWIIQGVSYYPWHPYPHGGVLHPFLILHCIYLAYFSLKIMFDGLHNPLLSLKQRNHLKYMIGAIIALSFGIFDFIGNYNIAFHEFGYIPVSTYLMITTIAIVRHQLMDIQIVIRKSLVYSMLITLITLIFLISVLVSEHLFNHVIHYQNVTASIVMASLIALIFTPLKNRIQDLVDRAFFKATPMEMAQQNEQLRQEITHSERMKSVAIFASGMAHEIKNPLTPIKTFSEQLPSRLDDKEFLLKFSKIINKEVDRIDSLVQELLSFAKPSQPQIKEVNIHQLIGQTLDLLNNEIIRHKINLNTSFENKNILINVDPQQIKQALLNIFLNAIEAMSNGGTLTIDSRFRGNDHGIIITITDTGCGINPKDLSHIFDPFFSKKDHGTGLGLSITHEIIKNHNGRILAESELGKGTTFRIELPL